MRLTDLTLLIPIDLEFTPARVGTGSPKVVKQGTRVNYRIERTGDYGDGCVLRLTLPKLVMGYKTYTWSRSYDNTDEMRADGFEVN